MKTSLALAGLALAAPLLAFADDATGAGPAVVPYRPSVSTPAQLSAPGYLELEAGLMRTTGPGTGASRFTAPYTLKLAFTPDWGIRVGGDAWVRQADGPGDVHKGGGDTALVLKRRFEIDDASAWGLELGEKFPTAGGTLGSGHADTTLTAIYSSDFAPDWHADINLGETRLGVPSGQARQWQAAWAACVSRAFGDTLGALAEFSGTHQAAAPQQSQLLVAATYNASPRAVFDIGFARGLTDGSPHDSVLVGVTVLLGGKLF